MTSRSKRRMIYFFLNKKLILVLGIIFFTGIAASFNDSSDREPGYQDVFDEICQIVENNFYDVTFQC